jgi:hypothetical protein
MEGWHWLERRGFLVPHSSAQGWHVISTEGEALLKRRELYVRWEKVGVGLVKEDLVKTGGLRVLDVGRPAQQRTWAWEWVQMKENQTRGVEPTRRSRKVFVVHGHDEASREKIARFLQRMDFEPIILHEQASRGRTVIEKVEAHADVGFAVVLLTPDDEGCEKGGTARPRARQNVVLELGYFLGKLGRDRVCALQRGEVEIPSDFSGVVYVPFDNSGGWKQALGRELEAARFDIDWGKAMGSH